VATRPDDLRIELLGGFRVHVGDREVGERDWPTRRAGELVALLALAGGRAPRDRVVEQLWPHLAADAGAANLRKAAHHARRALGDPEAVVLRSGAVELAPGRRVVTDVAGFLAAADAALAGDDPAACARAAAACAGELAPGAPYEAWTQEPRWRVHARLVELLCRAGAWERLIEVEPTDEAACRALIRAELDAGRRHAAIRWYERLRLALARELGARPAAETQALYRACTTGMRPRAPAFVGREMEIAAALGELEAVADDGATATLLVRGATGIGKSAFCREVGARARAAGWHTMAVTATVSAAPYGPLAAAVDQMEPGALEALPARTRAVLAALSPLAPPAGTLTRHQVVAALGRALSARGPAAVFVDDAHLCDEATVDVLHQLVAAGDAPLLVVLAYRAEWIRTSLPRGIVQLARSDRARTLRLGGLEDREVAELVAMAAPVAPPAEAVERIAALVQGSPFFAIELARALTSPSVALPPTVRAAVAERLAGLEPETTDALTALAVAAGELDLAGVLALTGLGEDAAFAVLDAALDAGVLVVSEARYRFGHELVRQALVDGLPPHRRVALHREAARRLAAAGGAPELVAHHWLAGERSQEAAPWLLAAARRAVGLGAYADGLGHVERLLTAAPGHREGLCVRAEILDALGDARAPDAFAAAADAVGDPEAQDLRARQALAQLKASKPDAALRTLRGVTPRTTAGRLAEALTLSAAAAIGRYADADTAAAKADEAHRLALELGDPGAILDATWAHALAAHARGQLPARLREYLRASSDLPALATRLFDGQLCVTERMLYGGLPNDEIIAFADSLAAEARRLGAARGHAFALTLRGEAAILAGRLDDADAAFADGARLHGAIGAVAGEALSLLGRAQVATYRGRPEHARPLLAEALLMARESEVGHHTLDRIHGAMVAAAADPAHAAALVREAETAIAGPAETCPTCRIAFIVPATIAAARAGDLERARRYARDCETALEIVALPPAWHAAVEEARGWLMRAEGRSADARAHFAAARDGFRAWGQPLDARRCAALCCA